MRVQSYEWLTKSYDSEAGCGLFNQEFDYRNYLNQTHNDLIGSRFYYFIAGPEGN